MAAKKSLGKTKAGELVTVQVKSPAQLAKIKAAGAKVVKRVTMPGYAGFSSSCTQ
ncbi:MAG: hypothetical protein ABIJ26_05845 [Candidatus Margulisiibacteriota bacterium]|nr:hypothetical protein [Candidatus Margulisiibacteriota bacterium]